jgi:hypothetical protein
MLFVISLLLGLSFPSASKTSWMRPESFRLIIGMTREEAMTVLKTSSWEIQKGEDPDKVVVEYDGNKAMTLEFQRDRLRGIRFELFGLIPDIHAAFAEERAFLKEKLGEPKRQIRSKQIVLYDSILPNVMMVASTDPQSENGRKGIGLLVVRYFDPLAIKR